MFSVWQKILKEGLKRPLLTFSIVSCCRDAFCSRFNNLLNQRSVACEVKLMERETLAHSLWVLLETADGWEPCLLLVQRPDKLCTRWVLSSAHRPHDVGTIISTLQVEKQYQKCNCSWWRNCTPWMKATWAAPRTPCFLPLRRLSHLSYKGCVPTDFFFLQSWNKSMARQWWLEETPCQKV